MSNRHDVLLWNMGIDGSRFNNLLSDFSLFSFTSECVKTIFYNVRISQLIGFFI
jgi:hypothetical protein